MQKLQGGLDRPGSPWILLVHSFTPHALADVTTVVSGSSSLPPPPGTHARQHGMHAQDNSCKAVVTNYIVVETDFLNLLNLILQSIVSYCNIHWNIGWLPFLELK